MFVALKELPSKRHTWWMSYSPSLKSQTRTSSKKDSAPKERQGNSSGTKQDKRLIRKFRVVDWDFLPDFPESLLSTAIRVVEDKRSIRAF